MAMSCRWDRGSYCWCTVIFSTLNMLLTVLFSSNNARAELLLLSGLDTGNFPAKSNSPSRICNLLGWTLECFQMSLWIVWRCEMRCLTHWHSVQQSTHGGQRSRLQHSIDLHWSDKKLQDKNSILFRLHFLYTVYSLDLDIYYQPSRATFLGTIFHHRRFSFEYLP